VVRVVLPGDVTVYAVTTHVLVADLVTNPLVSKDWRNWTKIQTGEVGDEWPLIGMLKVTNMVTSDGDTHLRLRRPVTRTFARDRVEDLRPRLVSIVTSLLGRLEPIRLRPLPSLACRAS